MITDTGSAVNARLLGWSGMDDRGDALQVCGQRRGDRYYLYAGHLWSGGITVLDVTDPASPEVVHHLPSPTPNTWNINLQVAGDVLLVANESIIPGWSSAPGTAFEAGVQLYDVREPTAPVPLGRWDTTGAGTHRNWWVGGRYAYVSASEEGFAGKFLVILDVSDPEHPHEVGRWWEPGQAVVHGEQPWWPTGPMDFTWGFHGAVVDGDTAYLACEDMGMRILDVADPSHPCLVGQLNTRPPFGGFTHTTLPLPGRDLVVVAEEAIAYDCAEEQKRIWLVDVREPTNPVPVATLPLPEEVEGQPAWCAKGGRFGPHNLHENRPGAFRSETVVFNAFFNAGLRVYDIADPYRPREIASYVPPDPARMYDPRPGAPQVVSSQDVYVDDRGYCFLSDYNAGLHVIAIDGEARTLMGLEAI